MSDTPSAPAAPPIDDGVFLQEAQRLRDYLLRLGRFEQRELVDALMPFEHPEGRAIGETERRRLFEAFQTVKARLVGEVDDYTLNEVLNARSPYEEPDRWHVRATRVLRSVGVTAVGILLVGLAFYYSNWSNRANYLLQEAESFTSFDHFDRMANLVDLALSFEDGTPELNERVAAAMGQEVDPQKAVEAARAGSGATPAVADETGPAFSDSRLVLDPQLMIVFEQISSLKRHYIQEHRLPQEMGSLALRSNPLQPLTTKLRRWYCPGPGYFAPQQDAAGNTVAGNQQGFVHLMVGCPDYASLWSDAPPPQGQDSENFVVAAFQEIERMQAMQQIAMQLARRAEPGEYTQSVQIVQNYAEVLRGKISTVHRWTLPIIYGMLGSIVYCMWRILNPATAPLGFLYTLMRTAFAGLAALTLSMLIVPSNALSVGADVSRPFVYLISFVFGYSIEGFVNLLNNLNRYLSNSMVPREDREAGKPAG